MKERIRELTRLMKSHRVSTINNDNELIVLLITIAGNNKPVYWEQKCGDTFRINLDRFSGLVDNRDMRELERSFIKESLKVRCNITDKDDAFDVIDKISKNITLTEYLEEIDRYVEMVKSNIKVEA